MEPPSPEAPAAFAAPSGRRGVGVTLDRVTHRYGGTLAVDDVSLAVQPGELIVLLGPSGCGKTTLLRIIAGLLGQSAGRAVIGDQVVDALPPNERGAGIVFQNYALFPHMTVAANVAYGLRARGAGRAAAADAVERMLRLVRMETLAQRYPRELSGGQQQRVALARTLAVSPKVLLLDEPFGALDKNLRLDMQIEVKRLQRELDVTTIMVTHDQSEALSMADRIAVMNRGRIEQFATPEEIYDAPATPFVAAFVGTTNLLRGRLAAAREGFRVELGGGALWLREASPCAGEGEVMVVVRPEQFRLDPEGAEGLAATVRMVLPHGPFIVYELSLADGTALKVTAGRGGVAHRPGPGDAVRAALVPGARIPVFPA
ncbi:MAG: ABC transporter ATP-binding protein [Candidatus Rokubacteria bacterium]|nr:ABC transporter ATP-binding protein [Candidatus Rokubacteria bacterium]